MNNKTKLFIRIAVFASILICFFPVRSHAWAVDDSFWCIVSPEYRPPGVCVSVPQEPPPTLSGPSLQLSINGNYELSWSITWGATKYQLQRRKNQGPWSLIHDVPVISYTENNIADGSYDYRVRACGNDGCTAWSGTYNIGVLRTPEKPLLLVIGDSLLGSAWSDTVILAWTASSATVDEYQVEHEVNGVFKRLAETTTSSLIHNPGQGGIERYRVRACNLFSCSPWSDVGQISVVGLNVPSTAGAAFTVSWSGVPTGIKNLRLREVGPNGTREIPVQGKTNYAVQGRTKGYYSYRLLGDACSTSPYEGQPTVCFPAASLEKSVTVNIAGIEGPSSMVNSAHPSTIEFDVEIDQSGRLISNIPLKFPSGINGLNPSLAAYYSTPAQNGTNNYGEDIGSFMGYGWNLNGLPFIEGTAWGQYKLNGEENLVLDNPQRLSGAGRTYRLQNDPNVRFTVEVDAQGSEWFVMQKGEEKWRFGKTANGRTRVGSDEYWFAEEVEDVFSNIMQISYIKTTDSLGKEARIYPRSINYGDYSLTFAYDYVDTKAYGNLRLVTSKITAAVSNVKVSEYRFSYQSTVGQAHLSQIQRCGYSAAGTDITCGQPSTIGWLTLEQKDSSNKFLPMVVNEIVDGLGATVAVDYVHESDIDFWSKHLFDEEPFEPFSENYLNLGLTRQSHSKGVWVVSSVSRSTGLGTMSVTDYAYNNVAVKSSVVRASLPDGTVEYTGYQYDPFQGAFFSSRTKPRRVTNRERWTGTAGRAGSRLIEKSYTHWMEKKFSFVNSAEFYFAYPCLSADFQVDAMGNIGHGKQTTISPVWNESTGLMTKRVTSVVIGEIQDVPPRPLFSGGSINLPVCELPWTPPGEGEPSNLADSNSSQEVVTTTYSHDINSWLIGFVSREVAEQRNVSPSGSVIHVIDRTRLPGTLRAASATKMPGYVGEITTTTQYDRYGNPTRVSRSGPSIETRVVRYEDYLDGRYPRRMVNALNQVTTIAYDHRFSDPHSVTDSDGRTVREVRDNLGFVEKVVQPNGSLQSIRLELCLGCPSIGGVTPSFRSLITLTHPSAHQQGAPKVITYHDQLGRIIRHEQQGFSGESIKVDTVYDDLGRVHKQSLPYVGGQALFVEYSYDNVRHRVTRASHPDGSAVIYAYDDTAVGTRRAITEVIAKSGETKSVSRLEQYNLLGQLVESEDAYGSNDSVTAEYRYDPSGNNRWVRIAGDPNTIVETHYDPVTNRRIITDPSTGTTVFQLDALGQTVKQTDANNTVITFRYDALGRLLERIDDADGSLPVINNFTYDGPNGVNRLASRTSPGFTESLAYDTLGQVSEIVTSIDVDGYSNTFRTSFTYDEYGRVTHQRHPGGLDTYTEYNQWGYAYELRDSNQSLSMIESVDTFGNPSRTALGNGLLTERTHDPYSGQLTRIRTDNGRIQDNQYEWWSNGTLHRREKVEHNLSETFAYDDLNRVTSAISNGPQGGRRLDFGYDRLGNLSAKTSSIHADKDVRNYVYDTRKPYQLSSVDVDGAKHQFSYDNTGNIIHHKAPTSLGDRHIGYSATGKPTQIMKGSETAHAVQERIWYGPDGERFFKHSEPTGRKIVYLFGGVFEINIPATGSTVAIEKTYLGDVIHVREVDLGGGSSERYLYVHMDHLGSPELMTDEEGNVIGTETKSFDPFGGYRNASWSSEVLPITSTYSSRGFTGHEHIDDVGLIHMNGRVYDPTLGRFMSADPFVQSPSYSQSYNRYSYVWNNPVGAVDPTGYLLCDLSGQRDSNGCRLRGDWGWAIPVITKTWASSWRASGGSSADEFAPAYGYVPAGDGRGLGSMGAPDAVVRPEVYSREHFGVAPDDPRSIFEQAMNAAYNPYIQAPPGSSVHFRDYFAVGECGRGVR